MGIINDLWSFITGLWYRWEPFPKNFTFKPRMMHIKGNNCSYFQLGTLFLHILGVLARLPRTDESAYMLGGLISQLRAPSVLAWLEDLCVLVYARQHSWEKRLYYSYCNGVHVWLLEQRHDYDCGQVKCHPGVDLCLHRALLLKGNMFVFYFFEVPTRSLDWFQIESLVNSL